MRMTPKTQFGGVYFKTIEMHIWLLEWVERQNMCAARRIRPSISIKPKFIKSFAFEMAVFIF